MDILIRRNPLRTRQPDLLFVGSERAAILGDIIEGAPNLVAEILSPSNTRADIKDKLADYGRLGVEECWLVSPEARTVEVLTLDQQALTRKSIHGLGDLVQSQVLPDLALPVAELFTS